MSTSLGLGGILRNPSGIIFNTFKPTNAPLLIEGAQRPLYRGVFDITQKYPQLSAGRFEI